MDITALVDAALDYTVAPGYSNVGLEIRRRLPGWPADPPRLDGKVVLITGARSGLGLAAAIGFAQLGASVRALGRDADSAAEAARTARARAGGVAADIQPVSCDVSSLAGLRAFCAEFSQREQRLDVLVNNAGVMPQNRTRTVDGVELTFATHVLAPWVLTDGLRPLLEAAAPSRVINVTSGGQYSQRLPAGDLESDRSQYRPKTFYARSKRAELIITQQWAARLNGSGVHVHAMHPGWADTGGLQRAMPVFHRLIQPVIRTAADGADTVVWLGGAPEAIASTGLFWHDRRPRPATYPVGPGPDSAAAQQELWDYVSALAQRPAA